MEKKSLTSNAIYNVIYKCLNLLFPLITMIYVSRILLPVGVGKVAAAQNIVQYFVILAALGLPTYGVKKIAECTDDKEKSSRVFSELFAINAISTIICSFFYIMMVLAVPYFHTRIAITLIVGIQLFANIINIDWLYQGFEEFRYIMYRSLAVKLIALISVVIFVRTKEDYIIYALITTLSLVLNYTFNIYHCHKYVSLKFKHLNIKQHLKPVLTLLATTIAIEIYTLADTTMLNYFKGDEVVGLYTNASKSSSILRMMIASICAVFLPRLNYHYSHDDFAKFNNLANKGLSLLINISLPIAVGLFLLADNCILILFGSDFQPAIITLRILSLSLITVALSNFMGYQILVTVNKEKIVLYSTILGAIVNVVLNFLLIEKFSQNGAAVASVITESCVVLYQFYYVKKLISIDHSNISSLLIPIISMVLVIVTIKFWVANVWLETIISFVAGILVYGFIGVLCGNEMIVIVKRRLKSIALI